VLLKQPGSHSGPGASLQQQLACGLPEAVKATRKSLPAFHPHPTNHGRQQTMAAANSRGDAEACGRGFIQAVAATLCVGAVLVVVLLTVPESLLGLFHTEREVMALAKTYCMIRCVPGCMRAH
jgi:hypothetical protein